MTPTLLSSATRHETVNFRALEGKSLPNPTAGAIEVVTERQRKETLLKTGALQNAIFNSANFSSIATDERGVIQIFNVGAERMLGYMAVEVVNKITPADISDPQEVIARAAALSAELGTTITPGFQALVFKASRGIEDIYELTYIRKDGTRFPAVVSVTALRDDREAIIGYLLIGTDNTARKQVEDDKTKLDQRLRDQQFYTRSLIESNIDALMTTDPAGIISDVNKQMEALTGCTRDELIGAPFKNFFTDPERAEAGIKLVLSEKKVANYELTARARDDKETVVSYNAATFYDRDRKLQGVFAAARDVTELKRFERSLQEASRMKSEFLANMSHELRTPLNGIIGFTEFLVDGKPGPLNPKQTEYLGDILNSGKHLLQLINDVLDLAKVESGKVELFPENFALAQAIDEVCAVATPIARKKRIQVTITVAPELGRVTLDQQKFKQVLYNLVSNGIKFTDDGGSVEISAEPLDADWFKLSVKDSGIGIKPEDIKRLFREFEQLESGAARRYEGTGLGLALTRKIVEVQGGVISVESELTKGSTFNVVLPIVSSEVKP
ncbi:MAG: PAS domain-containing sensor histidine kinase [Chthoniobacterales bacterium]|nr:MAG: PAS domain-containing sensor histidine kinase [Chthoniobacterales bacterium]